MGLFLGLHILLQRLAQERRLSDCFRPSPTTRLKLEPQFLSSLAEPLNSTATTIIVEANPRLCTMDEDRRILKIQNELVTYETFYLRLPPLAFLNCTAELSHIPESHEEASRLGLLDVIRA